jgi:iron complex transport system permease protein
MNKQWVVIRPRRIPFSFRIDRRAPFVLLMLTLIVLGAMILSVGYGEYPIAPLDVVKTILRIEVSNPDYPFIINTLRLPRMLVAFMVGAALGVSGTIIQGLMRNPLAAPEIIGVNAGAGLAAVTLIVLVPSAPSAIVPLAAFGGASLIALLIYLLAWKDGDSGIRLILIGIGLGAVATALTTMLITFGEIYQVTRALIWLTGSVYGRTWEHFWTLLPWVLLGIPAAILLSRHLNVLNLGEEVARGLGSRVEQQRGLLLIISVALAGASVATAGTIGFVGLMSPHIARRLVGPAHEGSLPTAAWIGGLIVVLSDLLGRSLFAPIEIPCGVITAVVGAPYFLYLLYRSRNA